MKKIQIMRKGNVRIARLFALLTLLSISIAVSAQPGIVFAQSGADDIAPDNATLDDATLTVEEQWAVLNAALEAGAANGATTLAEAIAMRHEVLLIELHKDEGSNTQSDTTGRAGDVYIYDYTTDTLRVTTTDLATGQVREIKSVRGVQLPLTDTEVGRSVQIALGNTAILEQTQAAYEQAVGNRFTMLDQLITEADLFTAVTAPNIVNMQSAECGIHRCAILTLQTSDGHPIGIQPVVDLSTQLVVQNIADPDALASQPEDLGFVDTGTIVDESTSPKLPNATTGLMATTPVNTDPIAASQPEDLGIVQTGMIIDESAIPGASLDAEDSAAPSQQKNLDKAGSSTMGTGAIVDESVLSDSVPDTTSLAGVSAEVASSEAPSQQNDLATVNTGIILDDSKTDSTEEGGDGSMQTASNDLEVVDTDTFSNESAISESVPSMSPGSAKANLFLPFIARRYIKQQAEAQEYVFDEEIFISWWCATVEPSLLAAEVREACNL